MTVSVVHWVSSRSKCLSCFSSIRCRTCCFSIYYVRSNGKDRSCRNSSTVGMISFNIFHKGMNNIISNIVNSVIIISVFWKISFDFIIYGNAVFVTNGFYFCIFNCGQRVSDNRKSCNTCCKPACDFFIMKRNLS